MSAHQQEILAELKAVRALLERLVVLATGSWVWVERKGEVEPDFWDEIVEAVCRTQRAAPLLKSELEVTALEKTIERRERIVEWWYEPGALQRMLRAISNDLNARDRQAFDRRTTEADADKRPRRRKPSKTGGAA